MAIARNQPCSCGSGRKYKHCCGAPSRQPEIDPADPRARFELGRALVHDMGPGLADGVSQGQAGPREFRTAPLWGLGQRLFFLHDGRTSDLREAIRAHRSGSFLTFNASEANEVIKSFARLQDNQKQDLLNFLRSL
jgi:CxxC motif-containing protein (DUF1111 family)